MILRLIQRSGRLLFLFAALYAVTAILSVGIVEIRAAIIFLSLAFIFGVLGFIFIISSVTEPHSETNIDALMLLMLFWCVGPIFCAIPYAFLMPDMTLSALFFEGVGAITTSGASGFLPSELPNSLHIWRALVQGLGGIVVTTFAVVILATLNLTGTGIHRSVLFTHQHTDLFARVVSIGRIVAMVYLSFSFIAIIVLLLAGASPVQAFCLALGGVSTGGLSPTDLPLAHVIAPVGALLFALICLLGAFNFAVLWDIVRRRDKRAILRAISNVEHRGLLVMIGILTLLSIFYLGWPNFFDSLVEAIFFVSTSGYDYNIVALELIPPVVLIAMTLIGGSALSTAGGIKIIRLLLLFRHLETDLSRLTHPSRIYPVKFRGQHIRDISFLSVWMYFFGYTLLFGGGILAFAATGLTFDMSVTLSAGMLSNMAPLLPYTFSGLAMTELSDLQKMIASGLMFAGRVEVLAILALISARRWES